MKTPYTIRLWERDEASALMIREVIKRAVPVAPVPPLEGFLDFLLSVTGEYPRGTWLAEYQGEMIGVILTMRGTSPQLARVIGGVDPDHWRSGVGSALWSRLLAELGDHPELRQLQVRTFASATSAGPFLERRGFQLIERILWLERDLSTPISDDLRSRFERFSARSLHVISAQDYTQTRPDWDHAWWEMETEAIGDVPTQLGVLCLAFDEWCEYINRPTSDLSRVFIALDGAQPIGVMKLGALTNKVINIDFTAVAASHRRLGVSLALKIRALEYARDEGARAVSTQNHEANEAILRANQRFGFEEKNALLDYLYELS